MLIGSINRTNLVEFSSPQGGDPEHLASMNNGLFWKPSGASSKVLNLSIAGGTGIEYIAGVGPKGFTKVVLDNGDGYTKTANFSWNGAFFFDIDPIKNMQNTTLTFSGNGALYGVVIGNHWEVPNGGEQSGYSRGYLARSTLVQSVVDGTAMPVATIGVQKAQTSKLQISNMPMSEVVWWRNLQTTVEENGGFFVQEVDGDPDTAFWAFDVKFVTPKAHASTRKLAVISASFSIYNGV